MPPLPRPRSDCGIPVIEASDLGKKSFSLRSLTFVEIKAGGISRLTNSVKYSTKTGDRARWDATLVLYVLFFGLDNLFTRNDSPACEETTQIVVTVMHDATLRPDECRGKAEMSIGELLDLQRRRPEEGKSLVWRSWFQLV